MAYISFDSIRSPDYVGTLSAVKVVYPLRESFGSMHMHHYKYDNKVPHWQQAPPTRSPNTKAQVFDSSELGT